ncbi:hypothetical protein [Changchengzhania lutea]|uniref:hypothetical protein n=1 Tax=Changchengzhania lutea TaxID=2049305 RepID=UPI00115D0271|nr:hypothetical protein [Changchengzhania lutea]
MSCGDDKKQNANDIENEVDTEVITSDVDADVNDENVVTSREYAMKDGSKITYESNKRGVVAMNDWPSYNELNLEMDKIEGADFVITKEEVDDLDAMISNLGNSIPAWLKTEEVMEDVADVQKEYKELINESDASEKEHKENLEELSEKFDDLREELNETVQKYIDIHKDAIEEYNEEIKKGKVDAANEEYQEEIKKMDKIADYEEKK